MGYSERVCELCGVSFNIGRIRKVGMLLPCSHNTAWTSMLGNSHFVKANQKKRLGPTSARVSATMRTIPAKLQAAATRPEKSRARLLGRMAGSRTDGRKKSILRVRSV